MEKERIAILKADLKLKKLYKKEIDRFFKLLVR